MNKNLLAVYYNLFLNISKGFTQCTASRHFWKFDNSSVITRQNVKVALAQPVLQCKNPAVEGRGSLSSSFRLSGLAQK